MTRIPIIFHICIFFLALFAGRLEAGRLTKKYPKTRPEDILKHSAHLYVLIPLFLLLFGNNLILQRTRHIFWYFPLWLQYYYSAVTWGLILLILLFLFILILTLSFRTRHKDRRKMVGVAVCFVIAIEAVQWGFTRPLAPRLYEKRTSDGVILQSSSSSCVPASAATILNDFFDRNVSEQELATLFGTTLMSGTSVAQLIYGLETLGIASSRKYIKDADLNKIKAPAVLFIDVGKPENHAIVFLSFTQDKVEIIDPLIGKKNYTWKEFQQIWHGRAVELQNS